MADGKKKKRAADVDAFIRAEMRKNKSERSAAASAYIRAENPPAKPKRKEE